MVRFTRQDFNLIADAIAALPVFTSHDFDGHSAGTLEVVAYRVLIERMADCLSETNPRFDRERFIRRAMLNIGRLRGDCQQEVCQ